MINRIRSAVNFIANNQVQGNITPTEFNIALNNAIMSIYDGYFSELNRMLIMETKGQIFNGLADAPAKVRERIEYFLDSETIVGYQLPSQEGGGVPSAFGGLHFKLPTNCRFIDSVMTVDKSSIVDFVNNASKFSLIVGHKHTTPTSRNPIAFKSNNRFTLFPKDIDKVYVSYLRNPKHPNWTANELG